MEDTFTKLFHLIGLNPRSLPPRNELILFTRAPLWTIYNPTKNERFECNRTNNVESRAPSFLDKSKMVDVKIHNGSCPSSRTLLSTTSFQTKFYHNIPLIWDPYGIDSIIESWIVIGLVVHRHSNLDFSIYDMWKNFSEKSLSKTASLTYINNIYR